MSSNHGMYNQLASQNVTLNTIRNDQKTLIANIGTDSSDSPLSQTALLRLQKDVIDNKLGSIVSFLDKDGTQGILHHGAKTHVKGTVNVDGTGTQNHLVVDTNGKIGVEGVSTISSNITNGTQITKIKGSDGSDIQGDGSGNIKANIINSININPANSSNGDHAGHSGHSVAVMLRGRTDIADHTTGKFLLCDSSGHLQCDVLNTANVKLEDLSSTINADNSGHSRSIAVGLRGRTDISDHTAGVFLKSATDGRLETLQKLENDVINASLSVVSAGSGTDTAEYAIVSKPYKGKITVVVENATLAGSSITLTPKFATSSGGTFYNLPLSHFELHDTGNCAILIIKDFVPPFIKVNIQQSSGGAVAMSVKAIY